MMRLPDFITHIHDTFKLDTNDPAVLDIARAMHNADRMGTGMFTHDGVAYKITAAWKDGCIAGDCNPATCWTDWNLTEVKPTE
jgi:hypothetical protein